MRFTALTLSIVLLAMPASADGLFGKAKDLLGGAKSNLPSLGGSSSAGSALGADEVGRGLKEALRIGSARVIDQVSSLGGFESDGAIHIPLPENLARAQKVLNRMGMSNQLDELETRLNRAAETASVKARDLFVKAVDDMTIDDAMNILNGPKDSATQYFRGRMTPDLLAEMKPVVDESLAEVGAIRTYENAVGQFGNMPLVPDLRADLTTHVLDLGLDGIFHYLAQEEAAIRANPAKRTTELLQKVFAN